MRYISAENQLALESRELVARDFLWIIARQRGTNVPVTDGMWSDVGNVSAQVVNPNTGLAETRDWYGTGTLVSIDAIPLVGNLSVQEVQITLSQVNERVERLVREYDCQQARVEIYRGLFDPNSRQMVAPAESRFVGFIDRIEINTPAENNEGNVQLFCVSHTQEFTRSNPATRSNATQVLRQAGDEFYRDADTSIEWPTWWGGIQGEVKTEKKRKKFLGIF